MRTREKRRARAHGKFSHQRMLTLIDEIRDLEHLLRSVRPSECPPQEVYATWQRLWRQVRDTDALRDLDVNAACALVDAGLQCEDSYRDYSALAELLAAFLSHPGVGEADQDTVEHFKVRLADAHLNLGNDPEAIDLFKQVLAHPVRTQRNFFRRISQVLLAEYCLRNEHDAPVSETVSEISGLIVQAFRNDRVRIQLEKRRPTYGELFDLLNRLKWINWG